MFRYLSSDKQQRRGLSGPFCGCRTEYLHHALPQVDHLYLDAELHQTLRKQGYQSVIRKQFEEICRLIYKNVSVVKYLVVNCCRLLF